MPFSNMLNHNRDFQSYLRISAVVLAVLWTGMIFSFQILSFKEFKRDTHSLAYGSAIAHFNKDKALRLWGTGHGGVYVPATAETPPNPYLAHVPERDIRTPAGKNLTLMNPAYMIRQLNDSYTNLFGISGHITSLKPLRPANAPDKWEREALEAFEQGVNEFSETTQMNGKPYLRLIRPVVVESGCLKCHSHQGYSVGDIRGGVSVAIPLTALLETESERTVSLGIIYAIIWLLGVAGLGIGWQRLKNSEKRRSEAMLALSDAHDDLETRIRQRTIDLEKANENLKWEIDERLNAQLALQEATDKLEARVVVRTEELSEAVGALQREVEERRRVEDELRDSEEKYRAIVEDALIGIYIFQDGRIIFANNQFARIFGYSREEVTGLESLNLVHPDDRARVIDIRDKRLKKLRVPMEYEIRGLKKNGEVIRILRRNTLIQLKGKQAIAGNVVDVSQRRKTQEALRESGKELRLLSSKLLSAEENERKRIARELHDGIGQALSAIKFGVENSLLALRKNAHSEDLQPLESIVPLTQKSIEEVRRVVKDLRPSILDDLGILATVSWFCREFQNIYGDIQIEEEIDIEEDEIATPLKTVIYRVLQETLNNTAKHSGAGKVRLGLRKTGCRIILLIEDNGQGFDLGRTLSTVSSKSGFGLIGVKERIELSGGTFQIRSRVDQGTRICATWHCNNMAVGDE